MDPQIKTKWVEALRSGEYLQTVGQLQRGEKEFCCLGVLCQVAGIPLTGNGTSCAGPNGERTEYNPIQEMLPGNSYGLLYRMNDSGQSFTEIADYIEETL